MGGNGDDDGSGIVVKVDIGIAVCVSVAATLTVDMAVSIKSVGLTIEGDKKLLHDVKIITKNKVIFDLQMFFNFPAFLCFAPNYN